VWVSLEVRIGKVGHLWTPSVELDDVGTFYCTNIGTSAALIDSEDGWKER
jgi:hypothetical protein